MKITDLKEAAQKDMANNAGEWGAAEAVIDGKNILVMAKKVGYNKPGRKEGVRYQVIEK